LLVNNFLISNFLKNGKSILKTATLRQSGITFTGTVINGVLGALFFIIAARVLGPEDFGILSVTIVILTLISSVGDLGTNTGLVRFAARFIKTEPLKALQYFKLAFQIKLAVALIVLVAGWTISPQVVLLIFNKPELLVPFRIALVGVGGSLLFSFVTSVLQTRQEFFKWSSIYIFTNLLRLILLYLFIYYGALSVITAMIAYISVTYVGFFVGLFLISYKFITVRGNVALGKGFINYNSWIFGITILTAISSRLDTLISARLISEVQLGFYSAANQLTQIIPQLVAALGTVIAPKMASMGDVAEFKKYLKKTQLLVLAVAFLGLLSIPIVKFAIPILYGIDYLSAMPLFTILLISMLIFLISVPVHNAIFYYFSYPKLFFWLGWGYLLIVTLGGWSLISTYGALGAAYTVLIAQIYNFLIPAFWVVYKLKRHDSTKKL